jgi:hypothetical protein
MIAVLQWWLGWFLGPLLAYAAMAKFLGLGSFREQVASLGLPSNFLAWVIALAVPAVEAALALLLLAGFAPVIAFSGTVGLLLVFTGFVAWVVVFQKQVVCYCFGGEGEAISTATIYRNVVLLALAISGLGGSLTHDPEDVVLSAWPALVSSCYGVSAGLLFLTGFKLASLWQVSRRLV